MDFIGNNSGANNFVFGIYYDKAFLYEHNNSDLKTDALSTNIQHDITGVINSGKKYLIVDGIKSNEYNLVNLSDFSNNKLIMLTQGTSLNYKYRGKIYYFKFYENNELVRDYIPVYNTITNSAGLYDKVEGKFYGNSGTGTFTEGPSVNN